MIRDFIHVIPKNKIREFARSQYNKVKERDKELAELRSNISKLEKQLGLQTDDFIDTPSLNQVMFDLSGHPCCSEHGVMNQYEHQIYRCVMCGISIQLGKPYSIKTKQLRMKK